MRKNLRAIFVVFIALFTAITFSVQTNYAAENELGANGGSIVVEKNEQANGVSATRGADVAVTPLVQGVDKDQEISNTNEVNNKVNQVGKETNQVSEPKAEPQNEKENNGKVEINNLETQGKPEEEKNVVENQGNDDLKVSGNKTTVKLSKTEANKIGELSGAKIKLVKIEDGKTTEIKSWESGNAPIELSLEPGTYKMIEEKAPNGYEPTESVTFTVADNSLNISSPFKAYTNQLINNSKDRYDLIYVHPEGENENKTVVYCFNVKKSLPPYLGSSQNDRLNYFAEFGTSEIFEEKAEGEVLKGDSLRDSVLKTIYNGYPHDKSGIKERYGLSDQQFRRATQRAIWHFTDNFSFDKYEGDVAESNAYKELIGKSVVEKNELKEAPNNMTLYIYTPFYDGVKSNSFQNLLSTRFIDPMTITLENSKSYSDKEGGNKEEGNKEGGNKEEGNKEESKENKNNVTTINKSNEINENIKGQNYKKSSGRTLPVTGDGLSLDTYLYLGIIVGLGFIFLGRKSNKVEKNK